MAVEALEWPAPPTFTDLEDSGQAYNMGVRFQVTEETPCPGVGWRVPDTVSAPPGGTHAVAIWTEVPAKLAGANFVPVPGSELQQVLFEVPITLMPGVDYIAAVYTVHYVFRASGGVWPSSPSGLAVADAGRLVAYSGGPDQVPASAPLGASSGLFYVTPLVGTVGGGEPEVIDTTGTGALTAAAAATAATVRLTTGSAATAVTAAAASLTARVTAATTAVALAGAAVVGSARATSGTARLLLSARGEQVRGGSGPRLVTVSQVSSLTSVSRPDTIITSTWG